MHSTSRHYEQWNNALFYRHTELWYVFRLWFRCVVAAFVFDSCRSRVPGMPHKVSDKDWAPEKNAPIPRKTRCLFTQALFTLMSRHFIACAEHNYAVEQTHVFSSFSHMQHSYERIMVVFSSVLIHSGLWSHSNGLKSKIQIPNPPENYVWWWNEKNWAANERIMKIISSLNRMEAEIIYGTIEKPVKNCFAATFGSSILVLLVVWVRFFSGVLFYEYAYRELNLISEPKRRMREKGETSMRIGLHSHMSLAHVQAQRSYAPYSVEFQWKLRRTTTIATTCKMTFFLHGINNETCLPHFSSSSEACHNLLIYVTYRKNAQPISVAIESILIQW